MTRVNILLPFFETSLKTNNEEIISEIIKQKYGVLSANIFWIDSNNQQSFQCVVRIADFKLNIEQISQSFERRQYIEDMLKRLKSDIFNVVQKYDELFAEKKNEAAVQKMKNFVMNEDSQVSLKIEEKMRDRENQYREGELVSAISELTRQNIKLKDTIVYYQSQFQFLRKANEQPERKNLK